MYARPPPYYGHDVHYAPAPVPVHVRGGAHASRAGGPGVRGAGAADTPGAGAPRGDVAPQSRSGGAGGIAGHPMHYAGYPPVQHRGGGSIGASSSGHGSVAPAGYAVAGREMGATSASASYAVEATPKRVENPPLSSSGWGDGGAVAAATAAMAAMSAASASTHADPAPMAGATADYSTQPDAGRAATQPIDHAVASPAPGPAPQAQHGAPASATSTHQHAHGKHRRAAAVPLRCVRWPHTAH